MPVPPPHSADKQVCYVSVLEVAVERNNSTNASWGTDTGYPGGTLNQRNIDYDHGPEVVTDSESLLYRRADSKRRTVVKHRSIQLPSAEPSPPPTYEKTEEEVGLGEQQGKRKSCWRRCWLLILIVAACCVAGGVAGGVLASKRHSQSVQSKDSAGDAGATSSVSPSFNSVYAQGSPGSGIGGFDLAMDVDRSIPFDYNHNGKQDHILFYRPGYGVAYIVQNNNGTFSTAYSSSTGIGQFDLLSTDDKVIAFDYEHSGKMDYLLVWRPGDGPCHIVKNDNGVFSSIYADYGLGGFDFLNTADRVTAFDNDHSGKQDHLVIYRPGTGTIVILANNNGAFTNVYNSTNGIGGYDLLSTADTIVAYDLDHSGLLDHLLLYRPGGNAVWILKHENDYFVPVYRSDNAEDNANAAPALTGIGTFDFAGPDDLAFAYDLEGSGKRDYLVCAKPGSGVVYIIKHENDGTFRPIYGKDNLGLGIGGFDLRSTTDLAYAFDYESKGMMNYLVFYRPGAGAIFIVQNEIDK